MSWCSKALGPRVSFELSEDNRRAAIASQRQSLGNCREHHDFSNMWAHFLKFFRCDVLMFKSLGAPSLFRFVWMKLRPAPEVPVFCGRSIVPIFRIEVKIVRHTEAIDLSLFANICTHRNERRLLLKQEVSIIAGSIMICRTRDLIFSVFPLRCPDVQKAWDAGLFRSFNKYLHKHYRGIACW